MRTCLVKTQNAKHIIHTLCVTQINYSTFRDTFCHIYLKTISAWPLFPFIITIHKSFIEVRKKLYDTFVLFLYREYTITENPYLLFLLTYLTTWFNNIWRLYSSVQACFCHIRSAYLLCITIVQSVIQGLFSLAVAYL